ncbi:MAG TPA: TetR/AcrR family transcriptional regulator [Candidatus Dormibacteraeota bacterium]|nr:TetR/AcrR family transcriptional regulator [Candidatus Dormibacteraeota bacterium]
MPKVAEELKTARRRQFVDAAWRCAATKGYRDMTVDDVCAEANLSKGAFYGYFDQKHDLLVALVEDDAADLDAAIEEQEAMQSSTLAKLRAYTRAVLKRSEKPGRAQLRADLWAAMLTEEDLKSAFADSVQRRRTKLRSWIEQAVARREIAEIPANALASILLALSDGLLLHASIAPTAFRWVNIGAALDVLLSGISLDGDVA